jgi:hypothetical protein
MVNEPPEVTVPSLIGKTQAEAQQDLQLIGLGIGGITTEPSDQYVKGVVIRQDPLADTVLHEGDSVTMIISSGPGPQQFDEFELIVPRSGTVVVTISDAKGTTELFREYCFAGERVQKAFTYFGTAELTITSNNEIIMEKTYEP